MSWDERWRQFFGDQMEAGIRAGVRSAKETQLIIGHMVSGGEPRSNAMVGKRARLAGADSGLNRGAAASPRALGPAIGALLMAPAQTPVVPRSSPAGAVCPI